MDRSMPGLPCPSPTTWACSNSCPSSQWCHPIISSSVVPFSSCPQSFPASGSFPASQFFASGGCKAEASASVLPWGWFPVGCTDCCMIVLNTRGDAPGSKEGTPRVCIGICQQEESSDFLNGGLHVAGPSEPWISPDPRWHGGSPTSECPPWGNAGWSKGTTPSATDRDGEFLSHAPGLCTLLSPR